MPDYYFIAQLGDPITYEDQVHDSLFCNIASTNITEMKGITEVP